jgi:phosphoglycerate dehydrogenase-like enzyme
MHGFHGAPVAEAAILLTLALSRDLPRSLRSQAERKWDRFPAKTLRDRTVGIFGIGVIAEALAPLCKGFGMTVAGISSTPRQVAGFDRMHGRDELAQAVRDLDFLVLLTPYTPATRGIVDAKVLGAMKPSSFLVNLARGGVVDEEALIGALKEGRIAGAALDVFAAEPLPRDHPFWAMPNVIATPHLGGFFEGYPRYALPVVEENLRKFLAGDVKGMLNIVER